LRRPWGLTWHVCRTGCVDLAAADDVIAGWAPCDAT